MLKNTQKLFDRISFLGYSVVMSLFVVFSVACSDGTAAQDNVSATDANSSRSSNAFLIEEAKWDAGKNRLEVKGRGTDGLTVTVSNAGNNIVIGEDVVDGDKWRVRKEDPASVPCSVRADQSDAQSAEMAVRDAPADCDDGGGVTPPPTGGAVSINSTSQNGTPGAPVSEQPFTGLSDYVLFSANDLGMHCGDFDTRISSILPPFNVIHTQVIRRGGDPDILTPVDGVEVVYSASSNPNDPILTGFNSAGGPVLSSMLDDGSVFKTNFWDVAREAYDPFYPSGILPLFYPAGPVANILDISLPMPNVERFYLGDGFLAAEQQNMPGIAGPYAINDPQVSKIFTIDQPFFTSFPFGYVAAGVDWYEAAGIPLSAFDDFGLENPWPLMRVQAKAGGQTLASLDTVLPISGEANCGFCHNATADGGNGAATGDLSKVALSIDDPANVPMEVSLEWAADINLLRLHDQKHGTNLIVGTTQDDPASTIPFKAVVCQTCHYTPALDLAQFGPLGPENDNDEPIVLNDGAIVIDSLANGRDQLKHKSMSNVMHGHHGTLDVNSRSPGDPDYDENNLMFPAMPLPVDGAGNFRDPIAANGILQDTCYQCHPGRRTDCLRGAMASGGMLCQDCHGDMQQVGDDFTRTVSMPDNIGNFDFVGNFYTDPAQPRVPWANEPGCGSCHTGDAMDNKHGDPGTIGDPEDGIRLMQAYLTTDTKATPIVPTNKRFAENTVPDTFEGTPNPGAGNPMLYRVSKGHEGVFCEACHGATHGIWPNGNPNANDNVAAMQLQGHTGTISECSTCHTGDLGDDLDGPHGMHAVGSAGVHFAEGGHEDLADSDPDACRACHGQNGEGTVLSAMHTDRVLACEDSTAFCPDGNSQLFPEDYQVTCTDCHGNEL